MPAWLLVLLIFLATHRLTRLAIADEVPIVKVPRDALIRFLDPTPEMVAAEPGLKGHWNGRRPNYTLFAVAGVTGLAGIAAALATGRAGQDGIGSFIAAGSLLFVVILGVVASGNTGRTIAYLLECPWCMSGYTGGALVAAVSITTSLPYPWLVWIAASSITGLVANAESIQDQRHAIAELEKQRMETKGPQR